MSNPFSASNHNMDDSDNIIDLVRQGTVFTLLQIQLSGESNLPPFPFLPPPLFLQFISSWMLHSLEDEIDDEQRKEKLQEMAKHIPTIAWSKNLPSVKQTQCAICLTDFEESESVKELPCYHHFHGNCLDPWVSNNPNCPLCKAEVGNSVEELKKKLSDREKEKEEKAKKEEQKKRREEQKRRRAAKAATNSTNSDSASQSTTISNSNTSITNNENTNKEQPRTRSQSSSTISNSNSESIEEESPLVPKERKRRNSSRTDSDEREKKRYHRHQEEL